MSAFSKLRQTRLKSWVIATFILFAAIAWLSPAQLPVTVYKLSLITISVVLGYHLDRALFPYASPGSYLADSWRDLIPRRLKKSDEPEYPVCSGYELIFAAVLLRRAVIVSAVVIGVTLGL